LRSDEVDADDNVPLDEMTVTSESTKDTFRDHIELD
jgi:hypothetical protein